MTTGTFATPFSIGAGVFFFIIILPSQYADYPICFHF